MCISQGVQTNPTRVMSFLSTLCSTSGNPSAIVLGWKLTNVTHEWSLTKALVQTGAGSHPSFRAGGKTKAREGPRARAEFLKSIGVVHTYFPGGSRAILGGSFEAIWWLILWGFFFHMKDPEKLVGSFCCTAVPSVKSHCHSFKISNYNPAKFQGLK